MKQRRVVVVVEKRKVKTGELKFKKDRLQMGRASCLCFGFLFPRRLKVRGGKHHGCVLRPFLQLHKLFYDLVTFFFFFFLVSIMFQDHRNQVFFACDDC